MHILNFDADRLVKHGVYLDLPCHVWNSCSPKLSSSFQAIFYLLHLSSFVVFYFPLLLQKY